MRIFVQIKIVALTGGTLALLIAGNGSLAAYSAVLTVAWAGLWYLYPIALTDSEVET